MSEEFCENFLGEFCEAGVRDIRDEDLGLVVLAAPDVKQNINGSRLGHD